MLEQSVEQAINKQINQELYNAYTYLAMSAHFEKVNLAGFATWMFAQYEEELNHAMRLFRYLHDRGGAVELDTIEKPDSSFEEVIEVFQTALEMEMGNTREINELYSLAAEKKDFATLSHLQWFLDEQVEEEKSINDILATLEIAGDDKSALLLLNQQMGSRVAEKAPA